MPESPGVRQKTQFDGQPHFLVSQQGVPRSFYDVFPDTPFTGRIRAIHLNYLGGAISPFNSYLVLLGIETLSERISKSVKSAEKIVEFLEGREEVAWVNHAHAKNSKYRALAAKYFPKGAGAILSFGLKANDRATMLNLMIGLNGYTLCSGIICEELNGSDYLAVPFKDKSAEAHRVMEIGYISKRNMLLGLAGERYIEELQKYLAKCERAE